MALISLLAILLVACKGGGADPSDAGSSDAGSSDAGAFDAGISVPVLADDIGIDLAQVDSFVVLAPSASQSQEMYAKHGGYGTVSRAVGDEDGPQLLALTLSGDVFGIDMIEASDGSDVVVTQPLIHRIYPRPAWIFFTNQDLSVFVLHEDGPPEQIGCTTIAARRDDGALFCSDLWIQDSDGGAYGNGETVLSNPAGNVVYLRSHNELNQGILYRVQMDGPDGPVATLMEPVLNPRWTVVNTAGDLLVKYAPPSIDPNATVTRIFPVDDGAPSTLEGTRIDFAISGEAGAADEDTFYLLGGEDVGGHYEGTVTVLTRDGTSYAEAHVPVTVLDWNQCSMLFRLADGIYMGCGTGLARVIEDATVLASPVSVPFTFADGFVPLDGSPWRVASGPPGRVVTFVGDGTIRKFLRHDGITQEDIPLDSNIALLEYAVSAGGTINFLGVTIDTNAKVLGTVPVGATEVTILSMEEIDPENVLTFTQVN